MSWQRCGLELIPLDDLIEHEGEDCPCGPTLIPVRTRKGVVVVAIQHHSLDGREHDEPDHVAEECPLCSSRA